MERADRGGLILSAVQWTISPVIEPRRPETAAQRVQMTIASWPRSTAAIYNCNRKTSMDFETRQALIERARRDRAEAVTALTVAAATAAWRWVLRLRRTFALRESGLRRWPVTNRGGTK
jgi:hypothetical protein